MKMDLSHVDSRPETDKCGDNCMYYACFIEKHNSPFWKAMNPSTSTNTEISKENFPEIFGIFKIICLPKILKAYYAWFSIRCNLTCTYAKYRFPHTYFVHWHLLVEVRKTIISWLAQQNTYLQNPLVMGTEDTSYHITSLDCAGDKHKKCMLLLCLRHPMDAMFLNIQIPCFCLG